MGFGVWKARCPHKPGPLSTEESLVWLWDPLETGKRWISVSIQDKTLLLDPLDMPIGPHPASTTGLVWMKFTTGQKL